MKTLLILFATFLTFTFCTSIQTACHTSVAPVASVSKDTVYVIYTPIQSPLTYKP